ncbi:hypothetical protein MRU69_02580 [Kocuria flava]|uniref:hypothetical protein n=1 Tax=Kocuria flava TaxID=446860 RepID=UPI001FF2B27D|nr:hypothetical protein [Kocuria flava]MCJ8503751.1 hypothetical protein [Kocuria flava]
MSTSSRAGAWIFVAAVGAAVASAAVLGLMQRWDGMLRFAAVTVVLLLTRRAKVPTGFVAAFSVLVLLAMWGSVQHWYARIPHFDTLVHVLTPGSLAAVSYFLLVDARLLPDARARDRALREWAPVLWVTLTGSVAAVLWEYYEWVVEQISPQGMLVGYTDTVVDLFAGMCGSWVAGLLVLRWAGRGNRSVHDRS